MPRTLTDSGKLTLFTLEGEDMGRRRSQRKGYLRRKGPSWIGCWREDVRDPETGVIERVQRSEVICAAKGKDAKTKREAGRIFWDEKLSKLDTISIRPRMMTSFREFIVLHFEPNVVYRTRSPHYRTTLKHLLPVFGEMRLRDIEPALIQRFVSERSKAMAPQTVKHLVGSLRAVFRHAKGMGFYSGDLPTEYVELPAMKRARRGALSPEQVWAIAQLLASPYRELVLLLALTGLRIGEALGLRWKRVNLEDAATYVDGEVVPGKCLLIREAWVRSRWAPLKTEGSEGLVPLARLLCEELALLKSKATWAGADDPVFTVQDGKPLSPGQASRKYLKPALKKLGISEDVSWHWLRHTLSTLSDQVGKLTEAERQGLLRHAGAEMTRQYTHADLERARAGLDAVAEAIWGGRVQ